MQFLPISFDLNCHILGFHSQTQKLTGSRCEKASYFVIFCSKLDSMKMKEFIIKVYADFQTNLTCKTVQFHLQV